MLIFEKINLKYAIRHAIKESRENRDIDNFDLKKVGLIQIPLLFEKKGRYKLLAVQCELLQRNLVKSKSKGKWNTFPVIEGFDLRSNWNEIHKVSKSTKDFDFLSVLNSYDGLPVRVPRPVLGKGANSQAVSTRHTPFPYGMMCLCRFRCATGDWQCVAWCINNETSVDFSIFLPYMVGLLRSCLFGQCYHDTFLQTIRSPYRSNPDIDIAQHIYRTISQKEGYQNVV